MRPMKPRRPGSPHEALTDLMTQIGDSQGGGDGVQIAADFEGKTKFTFYKLLDPDQEGELSFVRVARLTEHFGVNAAAEHLAKACGHVLVALPPAVLTDAILDQISADALKEVADVFLELAKARADNKICGRDAALILPEIKAAMTKLATVELYVKAEAGL